MLFNRWTYLVGLPVLAVFAVAVGLRYHPLPLGGAAPAATEPAGAWSTDQFNFPDQLQVGQPAPDFTLADPSGRQRVTLSELRGKKPVVLVFGSSTCVFFRRNLDAIKALQAEYADQAEFLGVYTPEAHPDLLPSWLEHGQEIAQKGGSEGRCAAASEFLTESNPGLRTVVDGPDNGVTRAYAAWPYRVVVVAPDGTVAYKGSPDRSGQYASDVAEWLQLYALKAQARRAGSGDRS